jgi:hypothetical protein
MYIVFVLILIVLTGAITITMASTIGMTHAAVDANFASKSVLSGGLTRTAGIVSLPVLAGLNPFTVTYDHYETGITVGDQIRDHGYRVDIEGLSFTENLTELRFPYALPLETFFPETGPIKSGNTTVIYFYNVRWVGCYDTAAVREYPSGVKGPFGEIIDF